MHSINTPHKFIFLSNCITDVSILNYMFLKKYYYFFMQLPFLKLITLGNLKLKTKFIKFIKLFKIKGCFFFLNSSKPKELQLLKLLPIATFGCTKLNTSANLFSFFIIPLVSVEFTLFFLKNFWYF